MKRRPWLWVFGGAQTDHLCYLKHLMGTFIQSYVRYIIATFAFGLAHACGGNIDRVRGESFAGQAGLSGGNSSGPESGGVNAGGSASGGASSTEPPVTFGAIGVGDWSTALATAVCARDRRCHEVSTDGYVRSMECVQFFTGYYINVFNLSQALESGTLVWDADALGQCLTDYAASVCDSHENVFSGEWPCMRVVGGIEDGDLCNFDSECRSGALCAWNTSSSASEKTCQPKACDAEAFDISGTCEYEAYKRHCGTVYGCLNVSYYEDNSSGHTCTHEPPEDDWCTWGYDCSYCENEVSDFSGCCWANAKPPLNAGKKCNPQAIGATQDYCEVGLVCSASPDELSIDTFIRRCITPVELGEPCVRDDETLLSVCGRNAYCDATATKSVGHCVVRSENGVACDPSNPHSCALGDTCNVKTGECESVVFKNGGEVCASDSECFVACYEATGVCYPADT